MNDIATVNSKSSGRSPWSGPISANSAAIPALAKLAGSYTIREIERDAAAGKSAIWGGASWEAPLIRACDTIPIGINELWREDSLRAEAVAETHHQIPGEFCSMIKAMVGRLHLKKDGPIKRVLLFGSTCEPIGNAVEHAKHDGYDIHWIDSATAFKPQEKHDELVRFLVKELQKVSVWLTGKPADEDRVRAEIKLKNRIVGKIRRILELRVKSPFYLASIPTLQVLLGSVHYFGDSQKFEAILDQLTRELEEAAKIPSDRPYIPLVLAGLIGGIVGGSGLLDAIEESNGVILGWVLTSTSDFREDIPPLESIANYLFDAQVKGELGEAAGASATYRRVRVEELVHETKARGIISAFITGCPYGSVVQGLEREHFKRLGVPMVALETTVHDQPPTEEQITKVKTFLEVLS
jgi:benzoyl-CoA reductase/2-hydroxyglutaryl-CoA dehydratase subunit BcrC/BadD/HgdB